MSSTRQIGVLKTRLLGRSGLGLASATCAQPAPRAGRLKPGKATFEQRVSRRRYARQSVCASHSNSSTDRDGHVAPAPCALGAASGLEWKG
jgi:hypothetical protein